ncbi:Uncharacterised protein [Mycobacteroides abscessus subsp. abscessus]|nr:Uncharacterised protein [Mycobacteroides abscessus subsp. abscessus]
MRVQDVKVTLDREAGRLPWFGCQVDEQHLAGCALPQRLSLGRHKHVRDDAREPRAGTEHHEVGGSDGVESVVTGGRVGRHQTHATHLARRRRDRDLSPDDPTDPWIGFEAGDIRLDLQWAGRHGKYPAVDVEKSAQFIEGRDRVTENLGQAREEQIADGMPCECAVSTETMLQSASPQLVTGALHRARFGIVVAIVERGGRAHQRDHRHSQITRRDDVELTPEPAGRAAVVGNRHHRRDVLAEIPHRRQRRVQAVASTERDDAFRAAHSRPRSRCITRTSYRVEPASSPAAFNREASSSAIATLRCLPPVHPTLIVMYRLPSRR